MPAQKNDKFCQGLFVTLAWISGSGMLIGAWIQRLASRLRECNLQKPTVPLFLTTMGNLGYRLVSPGVPVSKPQVLRKILPRVFTVICTNPALLALFGWHSCCRGGASHRYGDGVPMDLLAPPGGWFTVQGLKAYTTADSFSGYLSLCKCDVRHLFTSCLPFHPAFFGLPILPWVILFTYSLGNLAEVTFLLPVSHSSTLLGRFMNPLFGLDLSSHVYLDILEIYVEPVRAHVAILDTLYILKAANI